MKRLALLSLVGASLLVSAPALAQSDNTQPGPPTDQPAPPTASDPNKQPPPPTQPNARPNKQPNNNQPNSGQPGLRRATRQPRGAMVFRDDDQRHEFLMSTNPYYRDAYGGRRSGIMMAIIGGALGLSSIAAGSFGVLVNCTLGTLDDITVGGSSNRESCVRPWHHVTIWGGVGLLAVSLAVGITTAVGNHRRLKFIRSRYPVIEAGIAPGGGSMRLTWRF